MKYSATLLLACIAYNCIAEEEPKSISAEAELGALTTSGNTQSNAFKGKLDITHDLDKWLNNYVIEGFYKENEVEIMLEDEILSENQVTAEKYFMSAQSDYKLNEEHRGLFVYASYENDKFSGYDYQGTLAAGYSNRLFKTEATKLNYSIGPGLAYSKTENSTNNNGDYLLGKSEESLVLRISGNFQWKLSEHAKFTQTLSSDIAFDSAKNSKTKAETALTAALNGSFALKAGFSIYNNSVVLDNIEKTDTQTSLTLVYTY
ncbi:DUF481 domain-containing protein [Teredinibacter purpureus]|uniref:Putative salt-induced outer membrane protein n=1 Tax=Teredinibacter purpureus TaxID=2731756 RepID=A0A0D3MF82_9GAMM|nr:DUF481 domain-containing protein [Teredinibacter purpureus]AIH07677.1 putative salt-induced outer membrane protein [Teredinibacter purpureus]